MTNEAISVSSLSYAYRDSPISLTNVNLRLAKGSRTLLIGANGAGKSTLLQILAGKRMTHGDAEVLVLGNDTFRQTSKGVTFLGTEWAMNPVVRSDIMVSAFLDSVGGYRHKERRDKLLDILDVDLDWHMHAISDGERRRVQLTMGLMAPWELLLLDEVTTDLDVLVRSDLLAFLTEESVTRGATILYATHIFDGLDAFPTHVSHMRNGTFVSAPFSWSSSVTDGGKASGGSSLHDLALGWLKEDREERRNAERNGMLIKTRGARITVRELVLSLLNLLANRQGTHAGSQDTPSDSEAFYKKYDYSH